MNKIAMNKKVPERLLSFVILIVLAACAAEKPSTHGDQASVSAVGSWQGTLTTMTGGSGTQPFTAEITEADAENIDYAAVFTVGNTVYNVTGLYNGTNDEGDIFVFEIPLGELQPAVSPIEFYGMMWSGPMTENSYSGGWFLNRETTGRTPAGAFTLERLP